MMLRDSCGQMMTGATPDSLENYETALHQLQCYIADPVATIDRALSAGPDFVMAHVMRAYLHLLGTEPQGRASARDSYVSALALPAGEREQAHLRAIGALVDGHWHAASRILEDITIAYPRDALALQAGHLVDFYTGASRMLRDRIARALPAWDEGMPGYHAVLGMYAFGLEETGAYAAAERYGREAVAMQPRDGWAWHAVAHVMEMQGRQHDGIAWLQRDGQPWSDDSFFACHNWWHLALYHLDLGDVETVLALFDGPIHGQRSTVVLDLIDASALLWRLTLRRVDVRDRWQTVADAWDSVADAGLYAFNDAHAMMAFVGTGRTAAMEAVLAAGRAAMRGPADNAAFSRDVGQPVCLALRAFGEGRYDDTVRLLRDVRAVAHRFGGSHAQRDLLDLTMIEAALRDGQRALATALAAERVAVRPTSPLARLFVERANAMPMAA